MVNYGKDELSDKYYEQMRGLPEKAATTIRFFDRDGLITIYKSDAHLLAKNFFQIEWGVETMGAVGVHQLELEQL